ncbi:MULTISPECIES: neutral zinc metallopeptidase [Flavobacterium]|jgi:predicted metalloprotease|uniref:Metalloprotease n=1 Tax=Flavobacterium tructae TaxID=1114873 RepID=A0A1S1J6V6_9FLAO|nr:MULTISPECIES: neutral zinc metallopeptidase [Flavobacterium]MDL2145357.1 neutral zinc metallopeptidase [Flavobacterium tructae]OHT44886.1 metalloprotease [Flavobacterium tructae]OXB14900.1 metalloprotease [Flavobacterium tructae]URC12452.1 neutral zinc metallopeptidase [Flavobacterium sp. B183]
MKWKGTRESDNVEDRRSISGGKVAIGGGVIGIIILLLNVFGGETGQTVGNVLEQMQGGQQATETAAPLSKEDEEMGHFVRSVLAKTEDTWEKKFAAEGLTYKKPKLVLFRGSVNTACGGASSASGPFYCPGDQKVYMDLGFFEELKTKFGAQGGDFAIAYVIAHEIGHHIQTLLGTSAKMREAQEGKSEAEANKLSVALELQADFYAGVWAHDNQQYIEAGDIEEALSAANAVGDDAIQSKMQGQVVPDSFTHGTSAQRMFWFKKGFQTGDIKQGNTFDEIR